jgi:predicted RNase H-like nuclease (RuvC/YqgF family)
VKRCNQCELDLPASAFYVHRTTADRLHSICKECKKANGRRDGWSKYARPEYVAARARAWRIKMADRDLGDARTAEDLVNRIKDLESRLKELQKRYDVMRRKLKKARKLCPA